MVALDGKIRGEMPSPPEVSARVVSSPIQHQGVRDALRNAFPASDSLSEFDALLAKLR